MVQLVLGVALIMLLALIGTRKTFGRWNLPLGTREILSTGNEYLFVGLALGGGAIGLLDETTMRSLTPLFSLGLGSIGLIFGIQFDWRQVRRFPKGYFGMTVVQAAFTALVVAGVALWVLTAGFRVSFDQALGPALILGATASCTGQAHLAMLDNDLVRRHWGLVNVLRYMSGMDGIVGLAIFGLAFSLNLSTPLMEIRLAIGLQWFIFSIGLGVLMGFMLHLLTQVHCTDNELLTFVVGMVLFSGGISLTFRLSPLFVNMIMGLTAANLPGSKERIFNLLTYLEKPLYIVFLTLTGAAWRLGSPWAFVGAGLFLLVRIAGKLGGGVLAARWVLRDRTFPSSLGLGMISQGGMVIAMVASYQQLHDSQISHAIVTVVLCGVLASELVGVTLARKLLEGQPERAS